MSSIFGAMILPLSIAKRVEAPGAATSNVFRIAFFTPSSKPERMFLVASAVFAPL